MVNTIVLFLVTSFITMDPQTITYAHPFVDILPQKTFVVCTDQCAQPTPKIKKIIVKRDEPAKNEPEIDPYAPVKDFLTVRANQSAAVKSPSQETRQAKFRESVKKGPPAEEKPIVAVEEPINKEPKLILKKESIFFEFNSSNISPNEKEKLLEWLRHVRAPRYRVNGYTCQIGNEQNNMTLSENRAEAIRAIVLEVYDKAIVITRGMGKTNTFGKEDNGQNRRANIEALVPIGEQNAKDEMLISKE